MGIKYIFSFIFFLVSLSLFSQPMVSLNEAQRGSKRVLRYIPDGEDFVIVNGDKKFNRALYGNHTGFRVETGDVPEFALYLPRMGGNLSFGLTNGVNSLELNNSARIESRYRPGTRIYTITDPILQDGKINMSVLSMREADGMILKIETSDLPLGITLTWRYGGAADKRFSREGDLGVDPYDCFYLKPEYCIGNQYTISDNTFKVNFGKEGSRELVGIFPPNSQLNIYEQLPALDGTLTLEKNSVYYISIRIPDKNLSLSYEDLGRSFENSEKARIELASQVQINTPDPYFNTLGGSLAVAADGIWSGEVWLHGAVGWRMPLSGWRAAYVGDAIGWHDRARKHFDAYAASQVTDVPPVIPHPAQDPEMNLARAEKAWGTQMYSNGYICRNPRDNNKMHHYDMNLCYIDELLWHLNWTGDLEYARKMWPVLQSHLAWEKRNFDPNDDGLYDAYCCIWASDALQYNSGGVTHSSAYNYRANRIAAQIATLIGEDPSPYKMEAEKILTALNEHLWISEKGHWAEFKDYMGYQKVHESTAIWSIYHALDSDVHDPFQAFQATRYIDTEIPHISVIADGLQEEGYATISTTNWLPYSWSINNVAFAEVMHTSLAYWQAGRNEEAFKLLKSSILDGMYLGSSPGNFGQVSFYDAARGECYRDFGDPVGVASRAFIQGLFGILPDAMHNQLVIRPGFPIDWDFASLNTSDLSFDFKRNERIDTYDIKLNFSKSLSLVLLVRASYDQIKSLKVNGKETDWELEEMATGYPVVKITTSPAELYNVEIVWEGNKLENLSYSYEGAKGDDWSLQSNHIVDIYDPQSVLENVKLSSSLLTGVLVGEIGHRTLFVKQKQGDMSWWNPVKVEVKPVLSTESVYPETGNMILSLTNNSSQDFKGILKVNGGNNNWSLPVEIKNKSKLNNLEVPSEILDFGSNKIIIEAEGEIKHEDILIDWSLPKAEKDSYITLDLEKYYNANVNQIFTNEYLTPRSPYTTLQVPTQGIGEWCHPKTMADIDDVGLRNKIENGILHTNLDIPFSMSKTGYNIAFTSLWDNYPEHISIPLNGKARHIYLVMAGTTNHMQCHFVNGVITVNYSDGSQEILNLINPENWCPIEQDFYVDGIAFNLEAPRPYRLRLKTGEFSRELEKDISITEVYGRRIEGGAGILVDIPLDNTKELKSLELRSVANEVVIGIMGVTLHQ